MKAVNATSARENFKKLTCVYRGFNLFITMLFYAQAKILNKSSTNLFISHTFWVDPSVMLKHVYNIVAEQILKGLSKKLIKMSSDVLKINTCISY